MVLLGFSAFFSSAETAIFSMTHLRTIHLVEKKRKGAKTLKKLKDRPHKTLTTILIGNNLVNVSASVLATAIAFQMAQSYALGIATGLMTLLLLVLSSLATTMSTPYFFIAPFAFYSRI